MGHSIINHLQLKKGQIILILLIITVTSICWIAYSEFNRKVIDLDGINALAILSSEEIINAFEKNETSANTQYIDKIIAVKGKVKSIEKYDNRSITVVIGDAKSMSSVRCSMDSLHMQEIQKVKEGNLIKVKGYCVGYTHDELLGSDILLNRCVIEREQ